MNLGFIGIGVMGLPIVENLMKKTGASVLGYDVVPESCKKFEEKGGTVASKPEEVFERSDIIFLSLPTNQLVSDYLGVALKHSKPGSIIVDTSSAIPSTIITYQEAAERAGIELVDCPVSGGREGAAEARLAAMCGGKPETVAKVLPYLEMFCGSIIHMGDLGSGYAAKLVNQLIINGEIVLLGEAFAYAEKLNLNKQVLFDAIHSGAAGSYQLQYKGPKMVQRDYVPASTLGIHLKDMRNVMEVAGELDAHVPLTEIALRIMEEVETRGRQKEDAAVVLEMYREK